jgi:UDP-N-acetylmuramoyl-L-alanyl-D-glutamate--2,6-diaminopimelate ligase
MNSLLRKLKKFLPERHPVRLAWHHVKAFFAALRYGFPARKLFVIGITGTDGKTTTVEMTAHILKKAGKNVGSVSTASFQVGERQNFNPTQKTSVSPFVLQKFLRDLVQRGCTHAVVEVSSHGLVQGRVDFLFPKVAAITNVTPEHLDYHGSLEQYRADKGQLFVMLGGKGAKVLNAADPTFARYSGISSRETVSYGKEGGDLWISDIEADAFGSRARLHTDLGGEAALTLSIPGAFNLENALCSIACAQAAGIPLEVSIKALQTFRGAPGRMERIDEGQNFSVFVDFTVTPVAYEKTLQALRKMIGKENRILVLCGSCGDRMREKRPEVGRVVSAYADIVVVSNEDPYTEDPHRIIEEVWAGIDQAKVEAHKIFDRLEGIRFLLKKAKAGDAVIFCAKGADTTMWTAEGQIPWNEREIVREELRKLR